MAAVTPLIFYSDTADIEVLRAGDTLLGVAGSQDDISLTNASGAIAAPGSPVYISAASSFANSRANATTTAKVIGLVVASIANSASGAVRKDGTLTLTTGEWDTITGQTGGLTAGSAYYLSSATAGRMTTTVPTTNFFLPIGIAMSSTDFEIQITRRIRLS